MPIVGLGLHLLIALFFAVHAMRNRQEMYWLLILFTFPLLGSAVYFFAIFLPQSRLERMIGRAGQAVLKSFDPGRDLREAQDAFDLAPTANNQVRLATTMLNAGMIAQAVAQFDDCLRGPFANDPEIVIGAAQAKLAHGQAPAAIALLLALRKANPSFRNEQLALLLARSYAAAGQQADAGAEFASVVERFAGIEARVEYALWAIAQDNRLLADTQIKEIAHTRKHMSQATRALHQDLFKRLDAAVPA